MKKLFDYANQYVRESDWKIISLLKFSLCAMGILIGLSVPEGRKKEVRYGAALVFVCTCIPLMMKFVRVYGEQNKK